RRPAHQLQFSLSMDLPLYHLGGCQHLAKGLDQPHGRDLRAARSFDLPGRHSETADPLSRPKGERPEEYACAMEHERLASSRQIRELYADGQHSPLCSFVLSDRRSYPAYRLHQLYE